MLSCVSGNAFNSVGKARRIKKLEEKADEGLCCLGLDTYGLKLSPFYKIIFISAYGYMY